MQEKCVVENNQLVGIPSSATLALIYRRISLPN